MDMENTLECLVINIKETGQMIKSKEKARLYGAMVALM